MKLQLQPRVTAKSSATCAEACNALGNVKLVHLCSAYMTYLEGALEMCSLAQKNKNNE